MFTFDDTVAATALVGREFDAHASVKPIEHRLLTEVRQTLAVPVSMACNLVGPTRIVSFVETQFDMYSAAILVGSADTPAVGSADAAARRHGQEECLGRG